MSSHPLLLVSLGVASRLCSGGVALLALFAGLHGRTFSEKFGADVVSHAGVRLGNVQTYANAGDTVRFGYRRPSDFGVELARGASLGGSLTDDSDPRVSLFHKFSLFAFGAVDGRAVARDLFLGGNTFRSSRSVSKESFVADVS